MDVTQLKTASRSNENGAPDVEQTVRDILVEIEANGDVAAR